MAAISIDNCTVTTHEHSGLKVCKIITPATADDGDTIDVSTLFEVGCFTIVSGATDATAVTADKFTDKEITIPGSTDNEARTCLAFGH